RRDRAAAHHALHADPALHPARLRARLRRRPHRRGGRQGARRRARGQRLREVRREPGRGGPIGMTSLLPGTTTTALDVEAIRRDFAVLSREVNGRPLVYLDSASSSHKPRQVLDAERTFVEQHYSNVHRGVHTLSQEATDIYEAARTTVARFIGAQHDEIVFTKNVTESLNLVAYALSNPGSPISIGPGDEIVVTEMEHHSNLVPWQLLAERTGATLKWFGLTEDGRLDVSNIDDLITERTKVVSLVWVSNMLGTINPIGEIARRAHQVGAVVVVDASQAAPQLPLD